MQAHPLRRAWRRILIALCPLPALFAVFTMLPQAAAAQMTFQHPGVLVSGAQLDFVKQQVNAGVEPFHSAFLKAQSSQWGSLSYTVQGPPAGGVIDCGSYSNPNYGCSAEDNDATAAYTQALLYWITGNQQYANNAIAILNDYGYNLTGYSGANAPLQAAWGASKWARAAEIIRYSGAGWSSADIQQFTNMLYNVNLPNIYNGSGSNGNWELSMIEGMIGIAVFNNDSSLFQHAVDFWHQRVPAYFYYYPIDGPNPVPPPRGSLNWNGQTVFDNSVNGVAQETCRDFGHTEYGIAATMNAAETAAIQGVDLYGSERPRLEAALEFHTYYLAGNPVPSSVCGGSVKLVDYPTFEIGYNAFHNRLGDSLPNTWNWITSNVRNQSMPVDYHMMIFETLTHGGSPSSATSGPVSIDTGGVAAGSYVSDTDFTGGNTASTSAAIDTSLVSNPAPQQVYQSERWGASTYTLGGFTPGASYQVTLQFAEIYWTATGQREFNVLINGAQVLTNFDIIAAAGGAGRAIAKTFTTNADGSGDITIQFTVGAADQPKISGISVAASSSGSNAPDPSAWYNVVNQTSGLCVDDTGWGTANGTVLQQWACGNQQTNQEWQFRAAASSGYDAVFNRYATALAWDDTGGSTANGNGIQLWSYGSGNANQEWQPVSLGNGLWKFVNLKSGLCLDNTGSTSNGVQMTQWTCESGNSNQEFSLVQQP